ncbi:nucleolar complex-associated protein-domain-containing protein [Thamnocephalis sphaerospora]|uniref:Nucleolar complex-associated protein 3 n=1 Tax=Thamnocephalis sphaerospora TaxID=78915 RepID=A0A4V1IX46_9FUNG|nr:nucleolar complex-associated protein-domain-containing protein [Thamnocephalis sphaerospora]|eukprot:RKP09789.1 nucleolar complex-associated protein-domain-containing protein [Thamnocephalis sphaerospora]
MAISAVKRANQKRGKKGGGAAAASNNKKTATASAAPAGRKGKPNAGGKRKQTDGQRNKKRAADDIVAVPATEAVDSGAELSEEDMAYFDNSGQQDYGFLTSMDTKALSRQEKGKKRKNLPRPANRPVGNSSDDEDLSDEEHVLSDGSISENDLAAYEAMPRRAEWSQRAEEATRAALPIKLPDGRVRPGALLDLPAGEDAMEEDESEAEDTRAKGKQGKGRKDAESDAMEVDDHETPVKSGTEELRKKKEKLALIAQSVLADPEGEVARLKTLREMMRDRDPKARKLVYLTQLAIYKDIAPGYRIRELTEQERTAKVSADIKKLRKYEETLVFNYRAYLDALLREIKGKDADTAPGSMNHVVTRCLCTLLETLPHFNFRADLIKAVSQRLGARRWSELSELAYSTVVSVFREDISGEISLDVVKQITHMVKARDYNVHPKVLATFFHLKLRDELRGPANSTDNQEQGKGKGKKPKVQKVHLSKKDRKRRRVEKEVEAEMREAEAEYSREEKERMFNETLKMVFVTYFRVLKQGDTSPLLPAVLEGLAKFAHLISVDYFEDLLALLKRLMQVYHPDYKPDEKTLAERKNKRRNAKLQGGEMETEEGEDEIQGDKVRMPLLCLITSAQILSGHGEAINYDLKEFYTLLYALLFPVAMKASASETAQEENTQATRGNKRKRTPSEQKTRAATDAELVMRGLDALLLQRKHVPVERVAAFLKRIATASLHLSPAMAVQSLDRIRSVIQRKAQLDTLLSDEDGRLGNGVHLPELDDPDLCNPLATSMWELALFKASALAHPYPDHYDPKVREHASALLRVRPSSDASSRAR